MTDYTEVNKWTAEKCGVTEWKYKRTNCDGDDLVLSFTGYQTENFKCHDTWTIEDARCREVIREKFCLSLDAVKYNGMQSDYCCGTTNDEVVGGYYHSIKEAEIACILAIYESEK